MFRFLHMFSGKEDVLGKCLKEMARKEGLQLEVYSLDKLGEGDVDLTKDHPFMQLKEEAEASAFDAGHAGFPCNTFSRARWNMVNRGPPPVRSLQHIYGLPPNSPEEPQQAEVPAGDWCIVGDGGQQHGAVLYDPGGAGDTAGRSGRQVAWCALE